MMDALQTRDREKTSLWRRDNFGQAGTIVGSSPYSINMHQVLGLPMEVTGLGVGSLTATPVSSPAVGNDALLLGSLLDDLARQFAEIFFGEAPTRELPSLPYNYTREVNVRLIRVARPGPSPLDDDE